ncbi:hypothetical protein [Trueperella sp. LYQ143]|uniref:hypothetical protein n=1 Tax=unclassified Trueperella TaxID=2630174 RepID=UPI003982DE79
MSSRLRYLVLTPFEQADIVAGILRIHHIDAHVVQTQSGVCVVGEQERDHFDDWDIAELLGPDLSQGKDDTPPYDRDGVDGHADQKDSTQNAPAQQHLSGADPDGDTEANSQGISHGDSSTVNSDRALAGNSELDGNEHAQQAACVLSQLSRYGVVLFSADLGDDVGGESGVSGMVRAQRYLAGHSDEEMPAGVLLSVLDPYIEELIIGSAQPEGIDTRTLTLQQVNGIVQAGNTPQGEDTDSAHDPNMFAHGNENDETSQREPEEK